MVRGAAFAVGVVVHLVFLSATEEECQPICRTSREGREPAEHTQFMYPQRSKDESPFRSYFVHIFKSAIVGSPDLI